MKLTMVVLRLVHRFSSVLWVGFTFGMVLFITPTMRAIGISDGSVIGRYDPERILRVLDWRDLPDGDPQRPAS